MTQLPLSPGFDEFDDRDPRVRAFWSFHQRNPDVYGRLKGMALRLRDRGHKHYGVKGLFEVMRWHHALATTDEWKLNNNYTAFYARLLMREVPALRGFFVVRHARADEEPSCETLTRP